MAIGWTEGRDASIWFDTRGYLADNPDVAAAGMNPLEHFLQSGIYEGRQAVNDGMWS
jgi:serralysin